MKPNSWPAPIRKRPPIFWPTSNGTASPLPHSMNSSPACPSPRASTIGSSATPAIPAAARSRELKLDLETGVDRDGFASPQLLAPDSLLEARLAGPKTWFASTRRKAVAGILRACAGRGAHRPRPPAQRGHLRRRRGASYRRNVPAVRHSLPDRCRHERRRGRQPRRHPAHPFRPPPTPSARTAV